MLGIRDRRSDAGPDGFPHAHAFELNKIPIHQDPPAGFVKEKNMSDDTKVRAERRENFGKGFARRLRAAGQIPAVIYGHGTDPVHVALPGHQVSLLVRRANALLELDLDGTHQLTLVKDIQRDPVRQIIEHIDLLLVKKGEKLQVEVPVLVVGESAPGTMVNLDTATLRLEVEATHIPERIEISVEGREEGEHITAGDIALPKGATLTDDPELLIVAVSVPASGADEEAAEEAAEAAEAAPAEEAAAE
jgi:large subunit ribosomal protein L25